MNNVYVDKNPSNDAPFRLFVSEIKSLYKYVTEHKDDERIIGVKLERFTEGPAKGTLCIRGSIQK